MAKRIGIKDVAAAASVSVTTVSHALSGQGKMSDETRGRVERLAAELGYAPNRIASALRLQRSGIIGFVSDEIATTPFAGHIVLGAQEAAAEHGILLVVVNSNGDPQIESQQIESLLAQQVDGIVYAKMFHRRVTLPERLTHFPTVLVNAFDPAAHVSSIVPDEVNIGTIATRQLLSAGHQRIAHLTVTDHFPGADGRIAGYLDAMAQSDNKPCVVRVSGPSDARAGREGFALALREMPDLTAIFCFNDSMAMGAYQVATGHGLRIPDDLSVASVDNLELIAAQLEPGLTTVALPHYEMGRWAIEQVLRTIEESGDDSSSATQIELQCALIERQSISSPLAERPASKQCSPATGTPSGRAGA